MNRVTRLKPRSMAPIGGKLVRSDGQAFPVGVDTVLIGRDPNCGIWLDDETVSFAHVKVRATPYGLEIQDAGSLNGTLLNGARVQKGWLDEHGTIQCGNSTLEFWPTKPIPAEFGDDDPIAPLVGTTPAMRALYRTIRKVGPTELSILIQGETGAGKELVAEALHQQSGRPGQFIAIDCSTITETIAESVLFGHVKGGFTGAIADIVSPFEQAARGTVFLDEIGELPLTIQPKLLRALQKREIKPVGAREPRRIDVRVIAATRVELMKAVNVGSFRSDLYFRFAYEVHVPPLRERKDDIEHLIRHFVEQPDAMARIPRETLERLKRHDWPGNVRELENRVAVGLALCKTGPIDLTSRLPEQTLDLPERIDSSRAERALRPFHEALLDSKFAFEKEYWTRLHSECEGNLTLMGKRAKLSRPQVREYLRRYHLPLRDG